MSANMFDRFTDRARKVMSLARQEAQRLRHEFVSTESILIGLIEEGSGVAANVLRNLDVVDKIRREVEKIVQHGQSMPTMGNLPLTPRACRVIELAASKAASLGHNYIGTEHLLLGLVGEGENVGAQVLMNLGLKLEEVSEEVLDVLGSPDVRKAPVQASSLAQLHSVQEGLRGVAAASDKVQEMRIDVLLNKLQDQVAMLFDRYCPFKPGDKVALSRAPDFALVPEWREFGGVLVPGAEASVLLADADRHGFLFTIELDVFKDRCFTMREQMLAKVSS